ncbi:Tetratricopeptide repeat-containing protein [Amphritea atlantica]|uniref:Tetratricopeptide repeat-containing protein n=1 Tax=Amphritea atlantica TaxID=355243 RepID=A0A1H9HB66_9GAMM|nr:tetratricopeptide repeat protein [Amphritea atlantica]SEQ59552.1 Tetratricopeptide repeat-containing protein [Amphritea atlantica]
MEISYSDKKVLIVDNRLEDLAELKIILGSMGVAEIQVASSVNMALVLLREKHYDICFVLFDLGKDHKNGLQLIQEASAEGIRQFSTVFSLIVDPERSKLLFGSLDSSPDTYISKPYSEPKVRFRLEKIMRVKQVMQPLDELLDQGELQQALLMCDKLTQSYPALKLYIHRMRGIILLEEGYYSKAEKLFESIVAQRVQPWARVGQGMALCHLGDYLNARQILQQVIDESYFCVEAYTWLARTYRALGERGEAISLLRKAVMLQPTVPELLGALGSLAAQNQEWNIAVDAYSNAIRHARQSCFQSDDYYFSLVSALLARSSFDRDVEEYAIRTLEDAVLAFPGEPIVQFKSRLMVAQVYRRAGAQGRANLAARNAFDLFCELELTEQAEWVEPFLEGMEGTSVEAEAQAMKQHVNRDSAALEWGKLNIQGMLSYRKKDYQKALSFFVQADSILPNNPSLTLNLVQAALEQARHPGNQRDELLLQCDNALYSINYGALGLRQQKRYLSLSDRCADMVRSMAELKREIQEGADVS